MHDFDDASNDSRKLSNSPTQLRASKSSPSTYIEGSREFGDARSIRIPFFRWFGPTGIAPGYKKMLFDVRKPASELPEIESNPESGSEVAVTAKQDEPMPPLFEEDGITPVAHVLYPLLDIFFDNYGCHFPFYSRRSFVESVKDRKVSALVLNSACGLAARFQNIPQLQHYPLYLRGHIFAEKAKLLLIPLLNLPSYDVVASILMLVWLELACNRDVGVWMYMGMACRMAMDLGMHKVWNV